MQTSKQSAIIIILCCLVIVVSYLFYKKQHLTPSASVTPSESTMTVLVGIGTTTIDAIISTSSKSE